MSSVDPINRVIARLTGIMRSGAGWVATAPCHDDKRQSLSLGVNEKGDVLWHCHAGCATEDGVKAIGLTMADLFMDGGAAPPLVISRSAPDDIEAIYPYRDPETGELLNEVVRTRPKGFRQRRPDGKGGHVYQLGDIKRVLYRLWDVRQLKKKKDQKTVLFPEGEKDVDALWALKPPLPAVTNLGGASAWKPEYVEQLKAAGVEQVVVLPDNDGPGRKHAAVVAAACHAVGMRVKIVELPGLPEKGDVSDFLASAQYPRGDLVRAIVAVPVYDPATAPAPEPAKPEPTAAPTGVEIAPAWVLHDVSQVKQWNFPPTRWVVDGLIPERGVLWTGGLPKANKSLFSLYSCLAIACGREKIADHYRILLRPKILYVAKEDPGQRLSDRITDIIRPWGGVLPGPGLLTVIIQQMVDIRSETHMAELTRLCKGEGYTYVVLDTWTALTPGADPMGAADQTLIAQRIVQLQLDIGGLVNALDHSRKNPPEGKPLSSADIYGPQQKWQAAEQILMFGPGDDREMGHGHMYVEGKDVEPSTVKIERSRIGADTEKYVYAGIVEKQAEASKGKGDKNYQACIRAVEESVMPVNAEQVAEKVSLSVKAARNHLQEAVEQNRLTLIPRTGKGSDYYQQNREGF